MAKKREKSTPSEIPPKSSGMSPALWLVPLLALLLLLLYLALAMGYIAPFLLTLYQWKLGTIIIQLVLIALLVTSHALDSRSTQYEEEVGGAEVKADYIDQTEQPPSPVRTKAKTTKVVSGKPAPITVESQPEVVLATPKKEGKPEIVEYPEKVSGGIYADTHLPIGDGRFLKLRTLIARSCLLCEEHDKCFTLIRHDMSADGFNSNIDCKQGLNIEVSRA